MTWQSRLLLSAFDRRTIHWFICSFAGDDWSQPWKHSVPRNIWQLAIVLVAFVGAQWLNRGCVREIWQLHVVYIILGMRGIDKCPTTIYRHGNTLIPVYRSISRYLESLRYSTVNLIRLQYNIYYNIKHFWCAPCNKNDCVFFWYR